MTEYETGITDVSLMTFLTKGVSSGAALVYFNADTRFALFHKSKIGFGSVIDSIVCYNLIIREISGENIHEIFVPSAVVIVKIILSGNVIVSILG